MLAADSREIAAASKRDSSAMKGIAFLTMVFLPGTYIAVSIRSSVVDDEKENDKYTLSDRTDLLCNAAP